MRRFHVGSGIYGFRLWLFSKVLWRWLPARLKSSDFGPALPDGWSWNIRLDGRALYPRYWR